MQWMPIIDSIPQQLEQGFSSDKVLPMTEPLKRANNLRSDIGQAFKGEFNPAMFAWDMARMTDFFLRTGTTNVAKYLINTGAAVAGAEKPPLK